MELAHSRKAPSILIKFSIGLSVCHSVCHSVCLSVCSTLETLFLKLFAIFFNLIEQTLGGVLDQTEFEYLNYFRGKVTLPQKEM